MSWSPESGTASSPYRCHTRVNYDATLRTGARLLFSMSSRPGSGAVRVGHVLEDPDADRCLGLRARISHSAFTAVK